MVARHDQGRMVVLFTLLGAGVLFQVAAGGASKDVDPYSVVRLAVSGSGLGLSIAAIAAHEKRDYPACVAIEVLRPAFSAVTDLLDTRGGRIPGFQVDMRDCLTFRVDLPKAQIPERVAALVDSLVGATVATVESVVTTPDALPCRDREIVRGALRYVDGLAGAVVEELANPDGAAAVSSFPISFAACDAEAGASSGNGVPPSSPNSRPSERAPVAGGAPPGEVRGSVERPSQAPQRAAEPDPGERAKDTADTATRARDGAEAPAPSPSSPGSPPASPAAGQPDIGGRLQKLKSLLDQGLITPADYDRRKAEILSEL